LVFSAIAVTLMLAVLVSHASAAETPPPATPPQLTAAPTAKLDPKNCHCSGILCACSLRTELGTIVNLSVTRKQFQALTR
jgi:hypothetical protein